MTKQTLRVVKYLKGMAKVYGQLANEIEAEGKVSEESRKLIAESASRTLFIAVTQSYLE